MAIRIWNPVQEMIRQDNEFNHIFDVFRGFDDFIPTINWNNSLIDISENEKEITITSELPGFNKKDIEVETTPEYLIIRAESKKEKDSGKNDRKVLFRERSSRNFVKKIAFRNSMDVKNAKTTYEKGILTIKLPKMEKEEAIKLVPE